MAARLDGGFFCVFLSIRGTAPLFRNRTSTLKSVVEKRDFASALLLEFVFRVQLEADVKAPVFREPVISSHWRRLSLVNGAR